MDGPSLISSAALHDHDIAAMAITAHSFAETCQNHITYRPTLCDFTH